MQQQQQNFKVQLWITVLSVVLFLAKITAYYFTHSVAVLTDALESVVNVLAGFIGLYSLYVAAKPKDEDHPYGHGKAEFVSAAVEGTLIFVSGIFIIIQAVESFINHQKVGQLDVGLWLIGATSILNYAAGYICIQIGKRNKSVALNASGKHLQLDTYSTLGVIGALLVMLYTNWFWLDAVVAVIISGVILYNGYKIIRVSLAGIMDEADEALLLQLVEYLNANRSNNWIDLHNLRVIKYGSTLHVDCHLTIPWYFNIHDGHKEIDDLGSLIRNKFGNTLELFVHTDGCLPFSCSICHIHQCTKRERPFLNDVTWTLSNIISNQKHGAEIQANA